jgi:hypothetical protein
MMKKAVVCFTILLCALLWSCASEKPDYSKGNLDVNALVSVEESTFMPFTVSDKKIKEIERLFVLMNLPVKPYKTDFAAKMTIPEKVKYKSQPNEKNEKLLGTFFGYLKNPEKMPEMQGGKVFICGPQLTLGIKRNRLLNVADYTKIVGPFPYFKKQDVLIEYAIKAPAIQKMFNLMRNILFSGDVITVRKLNDRELNWYWVSNNYDIEEPIFIFDNGVHKLMIHFTGDGKIFFLDLFDDFNW